MKQRQYERDNRGEQIEQGGLPEFQERARAGFAKNRLATMDCMNRPRSLGGESDHGARPAIVSFCTGAGRAAADVLGLPGAALRSSGSRRKNITKKQGTTKPNGVCEYGSRTGAKRRLGADGMKARERGAHCDAGSERDLEAEGRLRHHFET